MSETNPITGEKKKRTNPHSVTKKSTDNLKPFGSGKLSKEEERQIQAKGIETIQRNARRRRAARELWEAALDARVKDKELLERISALGLEGDTVDVLLVASGVINTARKGLAGDVNDIFTYAGRGTDDASEDAHRALMRAIAGDPAEPAGD